MRVPRGQGVLRRRGWLIAALLCCGAAFAEAPAPAPSPAADDATSTTPGPISNEDAAIEQLHREIADLQALLDGKLPDHTDLQALFEIDLGDEAAVAQRVLSLKQRLAATADPDRELPSKVEKLRAERDRLRLAFLGEPPERRATLLDQDALRRQQLSLAAEQQASAAALAATEQARNEALADARHATHNAERVIATQQARLLAYSSDLTALQQNWAQQQQTQLEQRRTLLARYADITSGTKLGASRADALYASIREDLHQLREQADQALSALGAPSAIAPLGDDVNGDTLNRDDAATRKVRELRDQLLATQAELQRREADDRYASADAIMETLATLQARRIALLPMLSSQRRAEVTGFTRDGYERLSSEMAHLRLMVRWYPVQRLHRVRSFAGLLHNFFDAGRVGVGFASLIVVLAGLVMLRRRSEPLLGRARNWLSTRVQPRTLMLRVDRLMRMLISVAHELVLLLGVWLVFDWLPHSSRNAPELATLRKLAYAYALYALALAFIHRVLLGAVSRYRAVDPLLSEKIRKSLRLVAQLVLFVSVYLILAQVLLGRGALYGIARDVAAVGAILVAWRLIYDWRVEVTGAYLRLSPTGRLAELVRASQRHRYGLAITVAAFVFVAARGVWTWLRDLALGFRQTRKALAYLFRRQLERQSKNQPAPADPSLLPADLQAALSEDPADENLRIDRYTQLPDIVAIGKRMGDGGAGALIALCGERGAGKTTWLLALQEQLGDAVPSTITTLQSRLTERDQACRFLCGVLGVDETDDVEVLIARALAGPPRVVMIDLAQNLMLRAVGGLIAYELFVQIAQRTLTRVLWIASFARSPFEYLQRAHPGREVYDRVIRMTPWTEREIGELIHKRMHHAGYTADYDQLLLNTMALSSARGAAVGAGDAAERTADRYHRLVWDYSDGNPRVALHFFRLSLSDAGDRKVTVRLFPMPASNALDGYLTRTRLVLACLFHHENLSADEAARSLRFPLDECAHALDLLHRQGFLSRETDARYRITSHWNRAVLRFLQRQKLLAV